MRSDILRGDIWWVDWSPGRGSEQVGVRPALVVQTDLANRNPRYPNTMVVAVSTKGRGDAPSHVRLLPSTENGLTKTSFVKCEQMQTIDKGRLGRRLGSVSESDLDRVNSALRAVLSL